jgi:WD40 repeat protein
VDRGLLWLARSLERAASAEAVGLDRPLRVNLAEWARQLPPATQRLAHDTPVAALAFDPSGRYLLAGGQSGEVLFWDLRTGREKGPRLVPPRTTPHVWIGVVAFAPNGRTVATSSQGAAVIWDAATHRRLGEPLPHPPGMMWGLAFLPNGRLATCSDDGGSVRVWDLATRRVVLGPLKHSPRPPGYYTLGVSPDGRLLATGGDDRRVLLWDLGRGEQKGPPLLHPSSVLNIIFSRDSRRLLTTTRGGTIHVWDVAGGRSVDLPHQGTEVIGCALTPDGRLFATSTGFGVVRLWHTASLRPVGAVYRGRTRIPVLAFSPDGRRLAMGTKEDGITVVDVPPLGEAAVSVRQGREIHSLQYHPDGARIMFATADGAGWLDTATGRPLGALLENRENKAVECAALSPDGKWVAMGRWAGERPDWRGRVELWDPAKKERCWQSDPPQPVTTSVVAFSPDGKMLFGSCNRLAVEGGAGLWDVSNGHRVRPLLQALGRVNVRQAAFRPGGGQLLLACDDGRARLWDVLTDKEVEPERPLAHAAAVTACTFDARGLRLATGCRDGTVLVWDARTRQALVEPLHHDGEVSAVGFSPDGHTLLTGSLDGTARFWDAASGKQLGPTMWHAGEVRAVAFHPNGRRAATGGKDRNVWQWRTPAAPVQGEPAQVRLWVEVLTGMALTEAGAVQVLPADALAERRLRLREMGWPAR